MQNKKNDRSVCEINDAPGVWVYVCMHVYTEMRLYTGAGRSSNTKTQSYRLCKTTSKETASGHKN